ncbi:phage tail protein [Clostridium sp. 2-1]|uniref:phage tail protein n=1 Tax=Clostridium TaxID=1485 RepID=UPI000CDAD2CB|nr:MULTISPECIES: phage tail protein [Clostridium]MBN7576023.1 phage tail protein [Clostridium beijerinckii]MBN7581144.1 phage tail protein [Clostridium beijerinckii]MBN7585744.1 phage tail protein [Clostridium beijerinckii]MBO0521533.1 phage tail protein [Clostridium beijerinckii]POO90994.1 phage tail protein [Clostridium sp. 2-1]
MKKTLVWNNKKAEDEGLKIISLPPIQLSTPKIDEKSVDGRDGTLTEFKGYDSDTKSVECDYFGNDPMRLLNWLQGDGEVVFGSLPDRYYKAKINNVIPISQIIENQMYTFTIQFRCQPFGYLLDGKETLTLTSSTILNNNKATHTSKPDIKIYGSGSCAFTINSRTFNIKNIPNGSIAINSFLEEVLENKGDQMEGYFPYLDVGENAISWTGAGVTRIEIIPNWRCL